MEQAGRRRRWWSVLALALAVLAPAAARAAESGAALVIGRFREKAKEQGVGLITSLKESAGGGKRAAVECLVPVEEDAKELAKFDDKAAKKLITLFANGDDMHTRRLACRALSLQKDKEILPALLNEFRTTEHSLSFDAGKVDEQFAKLQKSTLEQDKLVWAETLLQSLAEYGDSPAAVNIVKRCMAKDMAMQVRRAAIDRLAEMSPHMGSYALYLGIVRNKDDFIEDRIRAFEKIAPLAKGFCIPSVVELYNDLTARDGKSEFLASRLKVLDFFDKVAGAGFRTEMGDLAGLTDADFAAKMAALDKSFKVWWNEHGERYRRVEKGASEAPQ